MRVRPSPQLTAALLSTHLLLVGGCGDSDDSSQAPPVMGGSGGSATVSDLELVINEVVSNNDGTSVDEQGQTDDWVEILNLSQSAIELEDYQLVDGKGSVATLPRRTLVPGDPLVLWADNAPAQGTLHLPFKLDSSGETLTLRRRSEDSGFRLAIPALRPNEAYARFPDGTGSFARCRYASPDRENGQQCAPPAPPDLPTSTVFTPYEMLDSYPELVGPLLLSEAALRPAAFIEIRNISGLDVSLSAFRLELSSTAPGEEFPEMGDGTPVPLPETTTLGPNERLSVDVSGELVAAAISNALFEGVLTLFSDAGGVIDRWDFVRWPEGSVLTRSPDNGSHTLFCQAASPGTPNDVCDPLPQRDVGDRIRHLRTAGDFANLAEGATNLDMAPVKFVYDMQQGGAIHLLSSRSWALHYTFVREVINHEASLDRCEEQQRAEFNAGWYAFSQTEYFQTVGRRYLLGTLVHHGGADLHTVEYALGDRISGEDMRRGFFAVMEHVPNPSVWTVRPQDSEQALTAFTVDGTVPVVDPNAPFVGVSYQPLTPGIGYGTLRYVATDTLADARLGPDVIVVTDDVPNDIALVGGLITEAFQTPLAHVNVLSQNRGTPNMALRDARHDPRIEPYLDQLVRFEVDTDGFTISLAEASDAEAFWESRRPAGEAPSPRLDLDTRQIVALADADFSTLPAIGVKAAQLAEVGAVSEVLPAVCATAQTWQPPQNAMALPVVHFVEHFRASGAESLLESLRQEADFRTDPQLRGAGLESVRSLILSHPVDPALLSTVEAAIRDRFGEERVRLRSSSNAEDLPGFNGAGLYTSTSVELSDPERSLEDGLRLVWSSLYNTRAYDERELARIEHSSVAMAILIHGAFLSERANGVAISRNILDPIRSDIYYMNVQTGEASVTNPAPGVTTEQFIYRWPPRMPAMTYQSHSSLSPDAIVISEAEAVSVACALHAIHTHFSRIIDPQGEDQWFTMETEFKLIGENRDFVIKQARPHTFSSYGMIDDCREI